MIDKERIPCEVCGKSFDSRNKLEKHKDDVHNDLRKIEPIKPHSSRSRDVSKKLIVFTSIGILVALGAGVGVYYTMGMNSSVSIWANYSWYTMQYNGATPISYTCAS